MEELEQAISGLNMSSDEDHVMSDDDKILVQHSIALIKVVMSYDVMDHMILPYLFRCVQNVWQTYQEPLPNMVTLQLVMV